MKIDELSDLLTRKRFWNAPKIAFSDWVKTISCANSDESDENIPRYIHIIYIYVCVCAYIYVFKLHTVSPYECEPALS